MIAPRRVAAAVAIVAALSLSACGGGDDDTGSEVEAKPPAAVLARADAVCRQFLRETKAIGRGALANPPENTLALTTERFVKPSIPVLARVSDRMHALVPAARNALFELYADLFDPAVILAEERLAAGRTEDRAESQRLEDSLTNLGREQRQAARILGLADCDIDFQSALLSSLSE